MITEYKNKIIGFYRSHKRMPSYAEIMSLVGFKSKNAVYRLVNKLIDAGVLSKDSSGRLIPNSLVGEVPMLGLVEAGFPSTAEEMSFDTMNIDEYLIGAQSVGSTYLLEVKGDSMIDEGIREGDLVVAERIATWGDDAGEGNGNTGGQIAGSGNSRTGAGKSEPKDGDIVIANVDDGWTMKYFRKRILRDGTVSIFLEAANKNYKPIYPETSLKIAAIVKGVIRKY